MDILKRSLAPITEKAWEEIDDLAKQVITTQLSGRRFVDVEGPKGVAHACEPLGRLDVPTDQPAGEPNYGVHQCMPLLEVRMPFELDIWELDNVERGAKDVDLDALEEACKKMAHFEEKAIFEGFEKAGIEGLKKVAKDPLPCGKEGQEFLATITKALSRFKESGIEGPFTLVVNPALWEKIAINYKGYPLKKHIKDLTGGDVLFTHATDCGLLVSSRGGDMKLIIGQDYAIGYHSHTSDKIRLFLTLSFTFRVLEPKAIIGLS